MIHQVDELRKKRFLFLNLLYEKSGGDSHKRFDLNELSKQLGFDIDETEQIVQYFYTEKLIDAYHYSIAITHNGKLEIENALSDLDQPTQYFPAVNTVKIHQIGDSRIQQDSVNEGQSGTLAGNDNPMGNSSVRHVFISYVHDNEEIVQRLCGELTRRGLEVWRDKAEIRPGHRWQNAIANAIDKGDFFLACISKEYNQKNESYMNEEITLAIERLRRQPRSRAWFIPVLMSGEIPAWPIGAGETLRNIQWVDLNDATWNNGINQILQVLQPTIRLRSQSLENLSVDDVKKMLKAKDLVDTFWNTSGKGLNHQYKEVWRKGKNLVIDYITSLTWQSSGSEGKVEGFQIPQYIQKLNKSKYGGFDDWRLPTIEEAASLIETKRKNFNLHISSLFDKKQEYIWTSDLWGGHHWAVNFMSCRCMLTTTDLQFFVRTVRPGNKA